jgi:phosphatidylglycerol:prolipoprotein diacylglycerol transferase
MNGFPYIDVPQNFGPINTFGILMALGVLFGSYLARKYVERNGMDDEMLRWFGIRLIVWGFIGAFVLNTFAYEWANLVDDPWKTIKGLGISSYGAIVAGAVAFFYYSKVKRLDRRKWADMAAWGAAGGWLLGRLGCAVVHDHLGQKTDFFLGVNVPPKRYPFESSTEVIRAHDLGLYEFFLWGVLLAGLFVLERWKGRKPGFLMGFLAVAYSIPRFLFELLRPEGYFRVIDVVGNTEWVATDARHLGLTFAQWGSIAVFLLGVYLLVSPYRPPAEAEAGAAEAAPRGAPPKAGSKKKSRPKKR